jgi:hypothetical protein
MITSTRSLKFVALVVMVMALLVVAATADVTAPKIVNAQRVAVNNDPDHMVVVISWKQPVQPVEAYQIQRKLFPWGWRNMATVNGQNSAWQDSKPAKRPATYRMRALAQQEKSKWSNRVLVDK